MKEINENATSPSLRSETVGPSGAGEPLPGTRQSVPDLEAQVAYLAGLPAAIRRRPL